MLTVLMATHNGAATLPRVLDAYSRLELPKDGWKLVVVDNASTDDTPSVLTAYAKDLPLERVRTERRGKNVALNIGLERRSGELIVFTDDDAVPDRRWLVALQEAAGQQDDFDMFGGFIEPLWPGGQCPDWVQRRVNLGATFAISPEGLTEGPMPAQQVWGPNMAVRARVFDAGHRFDEAVGPAAGQYMMGSEVEFTCRVEASGSRAWFVADARVGHIIRPQQLESQWIIDRSYRLGRHMFHQDRGKIGPDVVRYRGAPRWEWRRYIEARVQVLRARLTGDFERRFSADWQLSFLRGYLDEAARDGTSR